MVNENFYKLNPGSPPFVCLAPTAMNQQKFMFELKNGTVTARPLSGFYTNNLLISVLQNAVDITSAFPDRSKPDE